MFKFAVFFALVLASAAAFSTMSTRTGRMGPVMLFGGKKKAAPAPAKSAKKSSPPGARGGYVPEGLTAAQYEKFLKEEEAQKAKKAARFPLGKEPETLTEWIKECEKKGLKGKDMNLKGHRLVKAKDPNWYTDESPI